MADTEPADADVIAAIMKTTSCGRFKILIVPQFEGFVPIVDVAMSLKELSGLLEDASTSVLTMAVNLLEEANRRKSDATTSWRQA